MKAFMISIFLVLLCGCSTVEINNSGEATATINIDQSKHIPVDTKATVPVGLIP